MEVFCPRRLLRREKASKPPGRGRPMPLPTPPKPIAGGQMDDGVVDYYSYSAALHAVLSRRDTAPEVLAGRPADLLSCMR